MWVIAGVSFLLNIRKDKEEEVISAFGQNNFYEISTRIEGFAEYFGECDGCANREIIVKKAADKIGLNTYEINHKLENDTISTILKNYGKYADVEIKLVSILDENGVCESNYLFINIDLKNNIKSAMTYKNMVEKVFKDYGIEGDVSVIMQGKTAGYMDYATKSILTDTFLEKIDAEIISENRGEDLFVVYGYTKAIKDHIDISGQKINVTLFIEYNEDEDNTNIYLATPIDNMNY